MDVTSLILVGLFGSGGVVALITILLQHRQRMLELEMEKVKSEAKDKEHDVKIRQIIVGKVPLEHHPLFATIDEIEFYFLRSFSLPDLGRTIIIREMCVNMLRAWRYVIKNYAIEAQVCFDRCNFKHFGNCNKSENMFSKMLIEGTERYSTSWDMPNKHDVFGKLAYDPESFATMRVFIPIFQLWHSSREEVVRLASHEIPSSGLNVDCHGDWWDVMTIYQYAFVQMKYDALNAMHALNGELTGKKFLGITVGDISHK